MSQSVVTGEDVMLEYIEKYIALLSSTPITSGGNGGGNKILSRALPLLNLALKLRQLPTYQDKATIKNLLVQQVSLVCDSIKRASYNDQTVAAAQYVLCAFIDEYILATEWGKALAWEQDSLLQHFTKDSADGKRFFALLKEFYDEPSSNLDILELFYLCLNLGFAGKYRQHKKGQQLIKEMMQDLYSCIAGHRKKTAGIELLIKPSDVVGDVDMVVGTTKKKHISRMLWVVGLVVVLGFGGYEIFNIRLNNMLQPLYETAANVGKSISGSDSADSVKKAT